ncbi:MAG: NAD(P)-binding domain-containing protein [Bacteroidota bacterium]
MENKKLPIAIIGGGPVGMAAAAHLVKRDEDFILLESGEQAGANVLNWGHVRIFSPWRYNIDKAAEELLVASGWQSPDKEGLPTGEELFKFYLKPLSEHPKIKPKLLTNTKVISIGRKGTDKMKSSGRDSLPFVLQVVQNNTNTLIEARAVIDASGTWQNNNPLGSGGIFAFGELNNSDRITYGIPDVLGAFKERYKNKSVLVVGGGHSAINSILELHKLQELYPDTQIHWILRKKNIKEIYGGQENDALPARGALGIKIEQLINDNRLSVYTPFQVHEILLGGDKLTITGLQHDVKKALGGIDEIISNTGTRPDLSFLREVRVDFDSTVESVPALADLIDPNIHSCGTVRPHGEAELRQKEKDFYIVGMKSYGRAPTFLMATGYEQVRSVVAALAGDWEAAGKVELDLPETGVCSSDSDSGGACCGTEDTSAKNKNSCC